MIGIDLVSISRIQKSYERFGNLFLNRFLSAQEQSLCYKDNQSLNFQRIASFWAIKEAVSKALGVGIGSELGFLDISISKDSKGVPKVVLSEEKMQSFGIKQIAVSVTHDEGLAIASVLLSLNHFKNNSQN